MSARVVIVTGSREWTNRDAIWRELDNFDPSIIVQGGAPGADTIAHEWAKARGRISITMFADWQRYPEVAGFMRNTAMLEAHPEALVLAFPLGRSRGTRDCMTKARERDMDVIDCEE